MILTVCCDDAVSLDAYARRVCTHGSRGRKLTKERLQRCRCTWTQELTTKKQTMQKIDR